MGLMLVGLALLFSGAYGFSLAALHPTGRRLTNWFAGSLGVVVALGVLLFITSPAPIDQHEFFTTQQWFGIEAVLLSVGVFSLVYCAFGVHSIIRLVMRLRRRWTR